MEPLTHGSVLFILKS